MKLFLKFSIVASLLFSTHGCGDSSEVDAPKRSSIGDRVKENFRKVSTVDTKPVINQPLPPKKEEPTTVVNNDPAPKLNDPPTFGSGGPSTPGMSRPTINYPLSKSPGTKDWNDPKSYMPALTMAAIVIHPKQVSDSEMISKFLESSMSSDQAKRTLSEAERITSIKAKNIKKMVVLIGRQFDLNTVMGKVDSGDDMKRGGGEQMKIPAGALIIHSTEPIDRGVFAKALPPIKPTHDKFYDHEFLNFGGIAVHFADEKTVIVGKAHFVKFMFSPKKRVQPLEEEFVALDPKADLGLVVRMNYVISKFKKEFEANPMLGMIRNTKTISLTARVTSSPGDQLLGLDIETYTPGQAKPMMGALNAMLVMPKNELETKTSMMPKSKENTQLKKMAKELSKNLEFKADQNHLTLNIPAPKGYDNLATILAPMLKQASNATSQTAKKNDMKQIGLALLNYESTFGRFPRAIGDASGRRKGKLSWRVHILPQIDHAALWTKFHLDEDWNSPHNIKLIDQMPDVFKTPGVTAKGKTSVHVFTGKGVPFGDEKKGPRMRDFTDGPSHTFFAVIAGSDRAETWTKPGGLPFDANDPKKGLGNIPEGGFIAIFGGGQVKTISKDIPTSTLKLLIQHADGQKTPPY